MYEICLNFVHYGACLHCEFVMFLFRLCSLQNSIPYSGNVILNTKYVMNVNHNFKNIPLTAVVWWQVLLIREIRKYFPIN